MFKQFALIIGVVFLLIGILGFIDPLVTDGKLLGIFAVDPVHNMIHIVSGVLGIATGLARDFRPAMMFTWGLLLVYGLVTVLGFVMTPDGGMLLGLMHVNMADNVLHLLITVGAAAVIFSEQRRPVYH